MGVEYYLVGRSSLRAEERAFELGKGEWSGMLYANVREHIKATFEGRFPEYQIALEAKIRRFWKANCPVRVLADDEFEALEPRPTVVASRYEILVAQEKPSLKNISTEDLEQELKRRTLPKPLDRAAPSTVRDLAYRIIAEVHATGRAPKDCEHEAFEVVVEHCYGPEIWDWYRENCRE